jgi:riboflavin kinase
MTEIIEGKLIAGVGRGAKFLAIPIYYKIFLQILGKTPFLGTLNLKLDKKAAKYVEKKFEKGTIFNHLTFEKKSYGGLITIRVRLKHSNHYLNCVGVRPLLTTHDIDILEVVCDKNIREFWGLQNNDGVEIIIET